MAGTAVLPRRSQPKAKKAPKRAGAMAGTAVLTRRSQPGAKRARKGGK